MSTAAQSSATSAPTPTTTTSMTTSPLISRSPVVQNNSASRSSAQLASLLAETLRENEHLKRELQSSKRTSEKYERLMNAGSPSTAENLPPAALKRVYDLENKLHQAERDRDEYHARVTIMQEIWNQLDTYLTQCEFRAKDAREGFSKITRDAGGQLHVLNTKEQWSLNLPDIPYPNSGPFPAPVYLPTSQQPVPRAQRHTAPQQPGSLQHTPTVMINPNNNPVSLPSFTLPPHPGGSSTRVRPRAESIEGPTYSNGPPPAKKSRGDGVYRDDTRRSPIAPNALSGNHTRQQSSSTSQQISHHQQQQQLHEHSKRRGNSPRRHSSRSSSASLDEMLLEAADNEGRQPPGGMFTYPQPPPHPPRSPSPSHSPVNSRGVMFPGPSQGGGLHSYQTHIFAPPVTGAPPVKKAATTSSVVSGLTRTGSLAGNPPQSGHHGAHVLGPGGYPPTNAQGQRICRQCGLVGRYKDGKCVEKWGPGPEGPGTVCDKCRKKMKRVERRGTIESQQQREQREQHQQVQQALAHHRSQQHIAPQPGESDRDRVSSSSASSVRKADTFVIGPGMSYENPQGAGTGQGQRRGEDPIRPGVPALAGLAGPSRVPATVSPPTNGRRVAPTPPYIATLPGSNENEHDNDDEEKDEREREFRQRGREHERRATSLLNGHHECRMDVDHEGDDAEGDEDGDAEVDAEADLLEAVDAAEEALAHKSSSGSGTGDPEDPDEGVKMKVEDDL